MGYKGIDYGMGLSNIDKATGIRYGVINMNALSHWAWEDIEDDYGPATCGHCGQEMVEYDSEKHDEYDHTRGCSDYACESCRKVYDSDASFSEEPCGHNLDSDGYKGFVDSHNDLMLLRSPYYTRAQFCSPCAPGACHLAHPMDNGEKCYALGHDWFEGRMAPYPLWEVATDKPVPPGLDARFKTEDGYKLTLVATTLPGGLGWTDGDLMFMADEHGRPLDEDGTVFENHWTAAD